LCAVEKRLRDSANVSQLVTPVR